MNNKQVYLALLLILLVGAIFRLAPIAITNGTLREPDSYYYYSLLNQSHGLNLPAVSSLDSQPPAEQIGLYLMALVPHVITGISIYTIMLWIAPLIAVLTLILVFIFAKQILENNTIALLATFFVAVLPGALSYQVAGAFRGDSFLPAFTLISLICLVQMLKSESRIKKIILSFIAGISLLIATLIWSGGIYAPVVFIISTIGIMAYYIIFDRKKIINRVYPLLAMLIFAIGYIILSHMGYLNASFTSVPSLSQSTGGNAYIQETLQPTASYVISAYGFLSVLGPAIFLSGAGISPILITIIMLISIGVLFIIINTFFNKPEKVNSKLLLAIPLFVYLVITFYLNSEQVRFVSLACIPIAILTAYFISIILDLAKPFQKIIIPFIILITLFSGILFAATYMPADSINPSFINAMNWLNANTPANSTILTTWPDGSVVVGIANRHVLIDSVMADPQHYVTSTSRWYATNETVFSFNTMPNYVLIRSLNLGQITSLCGIAKLNTSYCSSLANNTTIQNIAPNAYWLWNSCNSINCHATRGNETYFLEYNQNQTRIYLIDYR